MIVELPRGLLHDDTLWKRQARARGDRRLGEQLNTRGFLEVVHQDDENADHQADAAKTVLVEKVDVRIVPRPIDH